MEKFGKFRNSYSYSILNDSVTQLNGAIRPILGPVVVVVVVVVAVCLVFSLRAVKLPIAP